MKEERFRQLLATFGMLTYCSFKFTKDGKFRKFGFMGFKSEEEAQTSLSHFNKSFIDSSWITDDKKRKVPSELEKETKGSVAVCLAPGETQLVQEVQRFLLHNGVSLDSFSQATAEQSKTVILTKNLPTGTLAAELRETFSHFWSLGRVLLPKGSITAIIVEFLEPLDAHRSTLAYSKVGLPQG
ncbi:putative RNA-binding protein 19 [Sciurus carolinensis]|uniref:RNA-binding protein 19 n=1 Tax=Sciurus carolinensis TaxID=30640 RepID=A0AA41TBB6_SCICA|nr:putative RNA-binding protein 19 [Sciurus carolinensis]